MNKLFIVILLLVGFTSSDAAQSGGPGPEHARLDTFAGRWTIDGEAEGERYTLSEACEWFTGRYHLICRREGKGPQGTIAGQSIMTWDSSAKAYALVGINSNGASVLVHGTPAGNVWTWTGSLDIAGRALKVRLTTTTQSPSSYTFSIEGSIDGKWVPLESGRGTKIG
jgi:Protein of unknown function (DUF1579)